MTAREFLAKYWDGELDEGLALLGSYTEKGVDYYLSFPDTEVEIEDEVDFQEYADRYEQSLP